MIDWQKLYANHGFKPPGRRSGRSVLRRFNEFLREFEPLGILLAVVALGISAYSLWFAYEDSVKSSTVNAWQLIAERAPGDGGKKVALEFLNRPIGLFCGKAKCFHTIRERQSLTWIDLSTKDSKARSHLRNVNLEGALIARANLKNAYFIHANLRHAVLNHSDMRGASLRQTDLREASLINADLRGADFRAAKFDKTELTDADLRGVKELHQDMLTRSCGNKFTLDHLPREEHYLPYVFTIPMCDEVDWHPAILEARENSWIKKRDRN